MNNRCSNSNTKYWEYYGGRGITVCDRWHRSNPNGFLQDVGPKPEPKHLYSIDRTNNDGCYEPSNCRWATAKEQIANRRNSKKAA